MGAITRKELDTLLMSTPNLNTVARAVLLAFARTMNYRDEVQSTFQSEETLATYAGVSVETLEKYITALKADGFLIVEKREKIAGTYKTKTYWNLGNGTLTEKKLMRRESNAGAANLIPNAKDKKRKGVLGGAQKDVSGNSPDKVSGYDPEKVSGSDREKSLGRTETNNNPNNKKEHGDGLEKTATSKPQDVDPSFNPPQDEEPSFNQELDTPALSNSPKGKGEAPSNKHQEGGLSGYDPEKPDYDAMAKEHGFIFECDYKAALRIPRMTKKQAYRGALKQHGLVEVAV